MISIIFSLTGSLLDILKIFPLFISAILLKKSELIFDKTSSPLESFTKEFSLPLNGIREPLVLPTPITCKSILFLIRKDIFSNEFSL